VTGSVGTVKNRAIDRKFGIPSGRAFARMPLPAMEIRACTPARASTWSPVLRTMARRALLRTRSGPSKAFIASETTLPFLARIRCLLLATHDYAVRCDTRRVFLQCRDCGTQTRGWTLSGPRFVRAEALPAQPRPQAAPGSGPERYAAPGGATPSRSDPSPAELPAYVTAAPLKIANLDRRPGGTRTAAARQQARDPPMVSSADLTVHRPRRRRSPALPSGVGGVPSAGEDSPGPLPLRLVKTPLSLGSRRKSRNL
jgi:hypothetical protein